MEKLVNKLAELQVELKVNDDQGDDASILIDAEIEVLENELAALVKQRAATRLPYTKAAHELKTTITNTQASILNAWDGEKKTIKYPSGTLKFRTTSKLEIYHPAILLADMFVHLQTGAEVMKYLRGFNLTAVKKYIGVHPQDIDIVELVSNTTVGLTTE